MRDRERTKQRPGAFCARVTTAEASARLLQMDEMKQQILIVEDDFLVALEIQEVVEAAGHEVVGPYRRLTAAWDVARSRDISAAFLDIRIEGGTVFPVANALQTRGIPFAFVTANPELITAKIYPAAPVINKPFVQAQLEAALKQLLH